MIYREYSKPLLSTEKKRRASLQVFLFSIFISSTFKKKIINQIFLANDDNDKI